MARSRICSICQKRPVGSDFAKSMGYCNPCLEEGEWENTHSDYGHETCPTLEEINDPSAEWSDAKDKENALAVRAEIAECWICHPELNKAQKEYKIRSGSTREGMKIHVSLRASGVVKANEVAEQIPAFAPRIVKPTKRNGQTTKLILDNAGSYSFELRWDDRGRFVSGELNGRKVRNVAELLRKLAA